MASPQDFAWTVAPEFDLAAMREAAKHLVGTHAFDAFAHGGCGASSTIKTISRIHIATTWQPSRRQRQIQIDIEGDAFLRRMIRIIVGTLAQVGAGLRKPNDLKQILLSKDRYTAGPSAPACGLTLMHVGFKIPK
jgi:tRNA pseudouridine38-40 synthase